MAYKVSGTTTSSGILHLFKDDTYLGYKNIAAGAYNAVVDTVDGASMTAVEENSSGQVVGYGGITGISTGDAVNITAFESGIIINSFQYYNVDIDSVTTATRTISEVNTDSTILIPSGWRCQEANSLGAPYLQLISSTQVRGTKGAAPARTIASFNVIEFDPASVAQVQYGLITITSGNNSNTSTVSSYDSSKSILIHLGNSSTSNTPEYNYATSIWFNGSTSIIAYRWGTGDSVTTSYCLVEFN